MLLSRERTGVVFVGMKTLGELGIMDGEVLGLRLIRLRIGSDFWNGEWLFFARWTFDAR